MFNLIPLRPRMIDGWPDLFLDDFFKTGLDSFKADINETENDYIVEADLPGFAKEDIEVTFQHETLTISANRDELSEESKGNYLHKERRTGQLNRAFVFENVDTDNIKAQYKDGVLKVNLPKKEVKSIEVQKIEIN